MVLYGYGSLCVLIFVIGSQSSPIASMFLPDITQLDIAFLMDATGSMTDYIDNARQNIHQVVTEIVQSSPLDVKMALIEYRDHPPLDHRFVIRQHDFTSSIRTMEMWLGDSRASGGGDTPEAVADALNGATKLSWRPQAAKIAVLITDAPPHGLVPSLDREFDNGCPLSFDPMQTVRDLAQTDVTLYTVGCEPTVIPYTDFFTALAYSTGGQYIPLEDPNHLIDAIIGGAQEELSLQKFSSLVEHELQQALVLAGTKDINEAEIAQKVYQKLSSEGAKAKQLLLNNQTLSEPSSKAKAIAECKSMAEVRKIWQTGSSSLPYRPTYTSGSGTLTGTGSGTLTGTGTGTLIGSGTETGSGMFSAFYPTPAPGYTYAPTRSPVYFSARPTYSGSSSGLGFLFGGSGSGSFVGSGSGSMTGSGSGSMTGSSSGSMTGSAVSSHPGKFSSVQTAITLDQINRLVNKEVSKLST